MLQDQVSHLLEELPDGASLLVAGPPLAGKTALTYRLLAAMGDPAIVVSTDDVADTVRSDYERITGGAADGSLGIVDCASRRQAGEFTDTGTVKYADSPGDLTGIGVKATDLIESFGERSEDPIPVGLDSLSTLLMFWEAERVYRFLRVFAAQLDDRGWPFVATAVRPFTTRRPVASSGSRSTPSSRSGPATSRASCVSVGAGATRRRTRAAQPEATGPNRTSPEATTAPASGDRSEAGGILDRAGPPATPKAIGSRRGIAVDSRERGGPPNSPGQKTSARSPPPWK